MIHLTQLIYIHEGQQAAFLEFEAIAIPLMSRYNGEMILRIRPTEANYIEGTAEMPYEIHYVSFKSNEDLKAYLGDEKRKAFLHLKEQSIRSSVLVKGEMM